MTGMCKWVRYRRFECSVLWFNIHKMLDILLLIILLLWHCAVSRNLKSTICLLRVKNIILNSFSIIFCGHETQQAKPSLQRVAYKLRHISRSAKDSRLSWPHHLSQQLSEGCCGHRGRESNPLTLMYKSPLAYCTRHYLWIRTPSTTVSWSK